MGDSFNVLKAWKPGDLRELSEKVLNAARIKGQFNSYSQLYELDGKRWKVRGKVSMASGDTMYSLVCVEE